MIRIGLRDARAHFPRFIMSIIAIALGVSFVIGAFAFREMLNNQVQEMMASNADHDVYVRGTDKVDQSDAGSNASVGTTSYNQIDASLDSAIEDVRGVSSVTAHGTVTGLVLVGKDGNAVSTMGAPTIGVAMSNSHPWRSATLTSGRHARGTGEIVLDAFAADRAKLAVGDTTTIVYPDGPHKVTVRGIFHTANSQAGAIIVGLDPQVVERVNTMQSRSSHKVDNIGVYGDANGGGPLNAAQQQRLADAINAKLPKSSKAQAVTGDALRKELTQTIQDQLGFIQPLILIFALIALFVGSFIIANTFSMIVRDSMRGYALLRTVGASPGQVFSTVVVQAVVLGVAGSLAGVALGWGMVKGIVAWLASSGTPLTGSSNPTVPDIIVGLVVGVMVSLIGAALPARRAATAPPLQAMNETVNPEKPTTLRAALGIVMVASGALAWWLCTALANQSEGGPTPWPAVNAWSPGWTLGIGAGLVIVGVLVWGPALVEPVRLVLGWIPAHVFPVTGRLATRNLSRSKRRTANTAGALFVGMAIVSCLVVIASSAKSSVASIMDTGFKADFAVMAGGGSAPVPVKATDAFRKVNGVKSVTTDTIIPGVSYDGDDDISTRMVAVPDSLFTDVFDPMPREGDPVRALSEDELVVGSSSADDNGWATGQQLTVKTERATIRARIGAIVDNTVYRSAVMVNESTGDKLADEQSQMVVDAYVTADQGANLAAVKKDLIEAAKPFYVITVMDRDEFKSTMSSMVDQVMLILYALLALSIVIAIFGIVNTLALSVSERIREIGLLRAIGTGKGQIRGMLAIEASLIAVYGTLLGVVVGSTAGAVIQRVYQSSGLSDLSIPWGQLGIFLLAAIAVGVVASLPPARKALKVPVLDAVASE